MQTYLWFITGTESTAYRCKELMNKAYGSALTYVRADFSQAPEPPALWGVPVGAGPDAGSNQGAALVEAIRIAVLAGTNQELTLQESDELGAFLTTAAAKDNTWWCEPVEEEEG